MFWGLGFKLQCLCACPAFSNLWMLLDPQISGGTCPKPPLGFRVEGDGESIGTLGT